MHRARPPFRNRWHFTLTLFLVACGGAAPPPAAPAAPSNERFPTPARVAPTDDVWALPAAPRDPPATKAEATELKLDAWAKAKARATATPATCGPYSKPAAGPAGADLGAVLLETDPVKQTAALAALEAAAKGEAATALRAMRADLAPTQCADAITDPAFATTKTVRGIAGQMLVGLSLAAKLSRTAANAPTMSDASDKAKVLRFIQGPLRAWLIEEAAAIDTLSAPAGELSGLARGVVAIEAGVADLRLVDKIRSAPTPSGWDKELKAVYEASLDAALEPRKTRGRDAALVGLQDFASAGIVQDARVDAARSLLSRLYGGRRIDALDGLLLPVGEPKPKAIRESVLALVPTDPETQKWFVQLNVPVAASVKSAQARFEMGTRYWRRVDFVEAAHKAKDHSLLLALSLALAKGPENARAMMTAATPAALGLDDTRALDALNDGMATYDAAHLRSLAVPEGASAGPYLRDVAARFKKAAGLLDDPAQRAHAEERAKEAEAAAALVR